MRNELAPFDFGEAVEMVLLKRSFEIEFYETYPKRFNNVVLVVANDELRLRFVKDRGDRTVDVASRRGGVWTGVLTVAELVDPGLLNEDRISFRFGWEGTLVALLDSDYRAVVDLFAEESLARTRAAVKAAEKEGFEGFLKLARRGK